MHWQSNNRSAPLKIFFINGLLLTYVVAITAYTTTQAHSSPIYYVLALLLGIYSYNKRPKLNLNRSSNPFLILISAAIIVTIIANLAFFIGIKNIKWVNIILFWIIGSHLSLMFDLKQRLNTK